MTRLSKLLATTLLAATGAVALSAASHANDRGARWQAPQGHFVVSAAACPDLREDLRDRRHDRYDRYDRHNRYDRRTDRRDRRVLSCPPRAWVYVPSRYERARYDHRVRPTHAVYSPRLNSYVVQTRYGHVPVHIDWRGAGRGYQRGHGVGTGLSFEFRF